MRNKSKGKSLISYCSFLTVILLVCIIQAGVGACMNFMKTISYSSKILQMKSLKNQASDRNRQLKDDLNNYGSMQSLEAIARTNLKMAQDDEVLVIIDKVERTDELTNIERR